MKGASIDKLEKLKDNLRKMSSVAIAYSGGVDSTFLLSVAHSVLENNAIAVTAISITRMTPIGQPTLNNSKKYFGLKCPKY